MLAALEAFEVAGDLLPRGLPTALPAPAPAPAGKEYQAKLNGKKVQLSVSGMGLVTTDRSGKSQTHGAGRPGAVKCPSRFPM
jgi:hypothetical protein